MLVDYKLGQGSIILRVKLRNSSVTTGAGLTGLTNSSSGLIISTIADNEASATVYTQAGSTIETITTIGTYAAPTATKCRFKEVDSTNHKGVYELHIADARFAVANAKSLAISISGATNLAECDLLIPLRSVDPYDGVRAGLSALPNASPAANGGLPTCDANNSVRSNILPSAYGTATAGSSGSITLQTALGADNLPANAIIALLGGTGAGQVRIVNSYINSTKVVNVDRSWQTTPDNTTVYAIYANCGAFIAAPTGGIASVSNSTVTSITQAFLNTMQCNRFFNSTATTTPATAGDFTCNYQTPRYNGKWCYSGQSLNIWWDSTNSLWTISTTVGTRGNTYWTATSIRGTWTGAGSSPPTGVPSFTSSGVPDDENWPLAKFDSSGGTYANLQSILGTLLTETSGYLAAGFKKFFNVASPTNTVASVDQTGDSYARLGSPAGASVSADVAAINAKTTNLPASPASTTNITAGTITNVTTVATTTAVTNTVNANLTQILGTALTETAGYLAAGFKKFFNVATPVHTVASVDQGGDSYAIVNSGTYGNNALLSGIQNIKNTTTISSTIPAVLEVPSSGSATISIVVLFNNNANNPTNLDSGNPTIVLVNDAGTDRSSRLGTWTNPATGKYVINYTSTSSDTIEGLHWEITGTISSTLRRYAVYMQVMANASISFTTSDRTTINNIAAVIPAYTPLVDSSGRVTLTTGEHTNIATDVQTGLTAQGLTTTRAGYLDVLNGLVASVWSYATRILTGFSFTVNTNDATNIGLIKSQTDKIGFNSMDSSNSAAANSSVATIAGKLPTNNIADETLVLAAINALPTSAPTAVQIRQEMDSNSTKLASAATATNVSSAQTAIIAAIDGLGSNVTVTSPLSSDGTKLHITQGDSYTSTMGNAISFNITNQTGLIGAIPHLRFDGSSTDFAVAPVITSGTQAITFNDVTTATTQALTPGTNIRYQIRFVNGSNKYTPIGGVAIIAKGL